MSFHRIFSNVFFGLVFVAGMLAFIAAPASAAARHGRSICDEALVLDLDATARLSSLPAGDSYLRIEVPAPGVLSLDASVPGSSPAVPVLVPVSASCGGVPSARPVVLERTMASLLLGIETPGDYVFRLTSMDPAKTLSEVKVRSGHSSFDDEDEIEEDADPFAGGGVSSFDDEDEIEEDADPFAGGGVSSFDDEDEIEEDADPFAGGAPGPMAALCGTGEVDDHGDTFACATTLAPGRTVAGEVANDWGDDVDVFRFVLPGSPAVDLWRVELVTTGATETQGALFDRRGWSRLARSGGGRGGNFRLVQVLRPGVYYVRVEGAQGAEGPYGLRLEVSAP
jgi:hypothetical protein